MDVANIAIGVGRAVLAWLAASLAGAVTGVMLLNLTLLWSLGDLRQLGQLANLAAFIWVLGAVASAPLALAVVIAIRLLHWPRPWSEVLGGALVAAALPFIIGFVMASASIDQAIELLPVTAPSGAVAGGIYWLVAAASPRIWALSSPPR